MESEDKKEIHRLKQQLDNANICIKILHLNLKNTLNALKKLRAKMKKIHWFEDQAH